MKDSFIFEGKKYISSRRASQISDYASDYIGQLCRAGKLDCRMIGRSWFVTEESLYLHKATISREEASRSRIENLKGPKTETTPKTFVSAQIQAKSEIVAKPVVSVAVVSASPVTATSQKEKVIPAIPWKFTDVSQTSIKSPYVYSSDDRPLLPVLNKKVTATDEKKISSNILDDKKKIEVVQSATKNIETTQSATKIIVTSSPVGTESVTSNKKVIEGSKHSLSANVVKVEKSQKIKSRRIISYPELTRSIILRRVIAPAFVFVMFFGVSTGVYITADKVSNSIGPEIAGGAKMVTANISDAFGSAYSAFKNGYKSVVAFFTSPARLAMETPKEFGDVKVQDVTPNGIVLSSSTGSDISDEALKQKIAGSFSDEVEINPDNSGTAGVITPVFKDTKGKDFIYVMVPVKDKSDSKIPL